MWQLTGYFHIARYTYIHCQYISNQFSLAAKQPEKLAKGLIFYLILQLVQINYIFLDNVRKCILYIYPMKKIFEYCKHTCSIVIYVKLLNPRDQLPGLDHGTIMCNCNQLEFHLKWIPINNETSCQSHKMYIRYIQSLVPIFVNCTSYPGLCLTPMLDTIDHVAYIYLNLNVIAQ